MSDEPRNGRRRANGGRFDELPADFDLRSLFLGPKAENADAFEKLLLEAFRDHVFWRRNFHPEDGFRVHEVEKASHSYQASISTLSQQLLSLLGELKAGVPFFSPRYIGHMTSDLNMASLVGYFATMLYNPNNVAAEASPVTSRLELEVAADLARMVGYDPERHWGHLTSGGTVANFEALWVARSVKYLPLALRWAAEELELSVLEVALPGGGKANLLELDLWELLNLSNGAALDATEAMVRHVGEELASPAISRHSLAHLGYQEYGRRLHHAFGDSLPPGVLLAPSTGHYSWEKICHALGLGSDQLVKVPVDERFRMNTDALAETLRELHARRQPVIACVTVVGTTEESSVDRVDRVLAVRAWAAAELGMAFHVHADAAWGGYAVSITRDAQGERRSYQETLADYAPEVWPEESVYEALCAVGGTDSITIDPHKLGFMPYPAGAVCFADNRARELVAVDAPYVFHRGASEWGYIGRYILEGSKPGASAAAVWMSHHVLPLNARGYGRLIGESAKGALALHRRLQGGDWAPFRVVPLPTPDINIVCFAVGHPALETLEDTNELVEQLYQALSVGHGRGTRPDYFATKTVLRVGEYGDSALPLVRRLGFDADDYRQAGGLSVLRCTVMDPYLGGGADRVDYIDGFCRFLRQVMEEELARLA